MNGLSFFYSMKKVILFLFAIFTLGSVFAQLNGNGYYRVQNKKTLRYIRVIDNRGSVNLESTTADLAALQTIKGFENVVSDPASIIYIKKAGDGYDFLAQGTSSYSIIGYYVKLLKRGTTYEAYAQHAGLTKYLCDEDFDGPDGVVSTNARGDISNWYIKPVSQSDGQYFGFKPTVTVGNEYYTTIYAAFPFTLPEGMTAYYITKVDTKDSKTIAVWEEVKDGKVPAATAVYVKCKSSDYADNKIVIGENGVSSLPGNLMRGVYFNNGSKKHNNQLAYDPNTMRVLGVGADGKLAFVTAGADVKFIPANTAYINVPAGSSKELELVSKTDYDMGIDDLPFEENAVLSKIYNVHGIELEQYQPGVNIVVFEDGTVKKVLVGKE